MAVRGDAGPAGLTSLTRFERLAFRLTSRMNQGRWKRLWCWCDRNVSARWINVLTSGRLEVYGLENVAAVSRERPLLLAANHRSFFDMFVVMSLLFRDTDGWRDIYFPVRGRFFYQSPLGLLLNCIIAWWAMYPPFFNQPAKRRFDQYSLRLLADLCREGNGRLIGFHPEGTRNRNPDPYSFLPPQPGIGRLILAAKPQVLPVFVAGLSNSLATEIRTRWSGGGRVCVHFGPLIDYGVPSILHPDATARGLAEDVMRESRALGEQDRELA